MNRSKQNTWRITQGKQPVKTMEEVVASLKNYINTYDNFESFDDDMFIEDMLYGIGSALGEEYKFQNGYVDFKKRLYNMIETNLKLEEKHNE